MDVDTYVNLTSNGNLSSAVNNVGTRRYVAPWQSITTGICLSPIIVLGVIGNIFSLLVWIKGRRRKTSTARYLSALAIADILVLLITAVEFWVGYVLHQDIRTEHEYLCKFYYYASFLLPAVSAWILVAVTVERALSVWIPHRINVSCRPFTAVIIILLMVFVLCLVYFPIFTGSGIVIVYMRRSSYIVCNLLTTSMIRNHIDVWLYLDLCLFFIVPFIIMLVCNIFILAKVVCLAQKRRTSLQARGQSTQNGGKSKKMLKTVTRRVILLSITYCVCNAPLSIFNAILISKNADEILSDQHVPIYRIIFHILMFLNNGVNFLLYCMIGSGFRKDFVGMFKSGSRSSSM